MTIETFNMRGTKVHLNTTENPYGKSICSAAVVDLSQFNPFSFHSALCYCIFMQWLEDILRHLKIAI